MGIRDEDVVRALNGSGIPLERWLAVGSHLIGYFDDSGRLMVKVIEDDELSAAAVKFLMKRGQTHQYDMPSNSAN